MGKGNEAENTRFKSLEKSVPFMVIDSSFFQDTSVSILIVIF